MKWIFYSIFTIFFVILLTVFSLSQTKIKPSVKKSPNHKVVMTVTSPVFNDHDRIPSKYTCDGQNINPPLLFADVPKEAKSLVLLVEDPDAPGGTYHHWTIYNMDPTVSEIQENSSPKSGKEGTTDFGKTGYGGPCPLSGKHHYFFKFYAVDQMLDLPDRATFNEIADALENHIIEQAELVGLYSRSN